MCKRQNLYIVFGQKVILPLTFPFCTSLLLFLCFSLFPHFPVFIRALSRFLVSVGNNSQNCLRNDPEIVFKDPKHKLVVEQDFHLNFQVKTTQFHYFFWSVWLNWLNLLSFSFKRHVLRLFMSTETNDATSCIREVVPHGC